MCSKFGLAMDSMEHEGLQLTQSTVSHSIGLDVQHILPEHHKKFSDPNRNSNRKQMMKENIAPTQKQMGNELRQVLKSLTV